ncbi:MAG: SDR family NAD(P)-dependent oxidoreductase, partial [Bradymonadaceae bacterium]
MTYRHNILITGCASGIGRHLATVLGENGHWVTATDIDEAGLEATDEQMDWEPNGIETALLDVTAPEDWRRVVDAIVDDRGRLDLLINSAGYLHPGYVFDISPDEIDKQVDVNLKGTMYGTRVVGETMCDQRAGHIVNFGSLASLAPIPGLGAYSGSKF